MSDSIAALVVAAFGVMVLAVVSVVLALKTRGDRSITWSGFGVEFRVSPCSRCPARAARSSDILTED